MLLPLLLNLGMFGTTTTTPPDVFKGGGGVAGSGGYLRFPRAPSERKRRRDFYKRLGIEIEDEPAAEVIAEVAERQVEALTQDEPQRTEELYRELQAEGIEAETRHFEALANLRERLIVEEIGRLMREEVKKRQKAEEEILDLLLMASHLT